MVNKSFLSPGGISLEASCAHFLLSLWILVKSVFTLTIIPLGQPGSLGLLPFPSLKFLWLSWSPRLCLFWWASWDHLKVGKDSVEQWKTTWTSTCYQHTCKIFVTLDTSCQFETHLSPFWATTFAETQLNSKRKVNTGRHWSCVKPLPHGSHGSMMSPALLLSPQYFPCGVCLAHECSCYHTPTLLWLQSSGRNRSLFFFFPADAFSCISAFKQWSNSQSPVFWSGKTREGKCHICCL